MSLFCLLIVPAFYLLRRTMISTEKLSFPEPGVISGLILGLVAAFFRFNWGELFLLRGYGFWAFIVQLIDGAPYDALLPIGCYALIRRFGRPRRRFDAAEAANFALAWLAPICLFRALYWTVPDPVRLVIIPILFVVLALAVPYWIRRSLDDYGTSQALSVGAAVLLPIASAATTWAMYTNRPILSLLFFCAVFVPVSPIALPYIKTIFERLKSGFVR